MKTRILFILTLFTILNGHVSAQTAPISACDGNRYINQVFADYTKTVVTYGSNVGAAGGNQVTLYMDIYQPKNDTATSRPAIVVAHGGSFIFGDKSDMSAYCIDLAKRGYVAVSIQYRLYPIFQLGAPDSIKIMRQGIMAMGDMKAAVRELRLDAATTNLYKVNPNWIFSGGYSAGAITALHVAQLDDTDPMLPFVRTAVDSLGGINGSTGTATNKQYPSNVKAVMSLSGALYDPLWIDANDVPMYSIHGTADATVFYNVGLAAGIMTLNGSGNLHPRADAVGLPNHLRTVTGAGHSDLYTDASYAPEVTAYFNETLGRFEEMFCGLSSDGIMTYTVNPLTWSAMPNPSAGALRFDLPLDVTFAELEISSMDGRLVRNIQVADMQFVNLSALPQGVYSARILDAKLNYPAIKLVVAE